VYDLLVALVRSGGRLATKRELLDLVWPETFVEEGILAVHISTLRKALGDGDRERRYIETVSGRGYRFVAGVKCVPEEATLPAQLSIAVLPARPFLNEMFSEGERYRGLALADALIERLGRSGKLLVRPTRSVRAYVNDQGDAAAIGRSLRVDAVIEVRLLATAGRINIAVCLKRSQDGASLWAGTFDERPAALNAVADSIVERVAAQVGTEFREDSIPPAPIRPTARPEVHELFGRGRFHLLASSMFEVPKAVQAFRGAIELDPAYAPAHAGLALAWCLQAAMRLIPPADAYNGARAAALRALAMDDSCVDAQVALGAVLFFADWNWDGAERSLARALHRNPNHCEALLIYGEVLECRGRLEDGLQMKLKALERDPFAPLVHLHISLSCWNQRRYTEAIEWANKALELDPQHPHVSEHLAGAYCKLGDHDRFLSENLKHAELQAASADTLERLNQAYACQGVAGIRKLTIEFAASHRQTVPALQLAIAHGELGDLDTGFQHLNQAIEAHDHSLIHLAVGPQFDSLRGDPRFRDALSRMGLPTAVP
jgi:serine/threonine-protein kinase